MQIFLSPQVKRSVIISKNLVYTSCLIFAAGGPLCPHKKKKRLNNVHGIFADGRVKSPHKKKKRLNNLSKLGNIRKISKTS